MRVVDYLAQPGVVQSRSDAMGPLRSPHRLADGLAHRLAGRAPTANLRTGFETDALSVSKPGTPAPGSMASPPVDPGAVGVSQVSPGGRAPRPKDAVLGTLRDAIRKIEGSVALDDPRAPLHGHSVGWHLGVEAVDRLLPEGLEPGALHEVKARSCVARPKLGPSLGGASAGDWMASFGFALRLAVRRAAQLDMARDTRAAPWMLWCWSRAFAAEFGGLTARGLMDLGFDPARLLIVETARAGDALAALEDGVRSGALGLAFGVFDDIALTPARRLSLAAQASGTPCLLITHPSSQATGATATRWRIGRALSAPHVVDSRAPGDARFNVALERCRQAPQNAGLSTVDNRFLPLEWCDETRSFSLASGMADRAHGARDTRRRAVR
jgi:protein ImuA